MDIWSLLRKNKATYADLEKSVFSRKYLNAYENFDYSFDGPVFHPRWNRETFYAGTEKETLIKNIRNLSLMGVCALAVYFLLNVTGAALQNAILESIYLYCQTLIYVTTLLIPLYTTGLLGKFEQKKKSKRFDCMFGPVRIILCVIGAFAVAAVVQILLSNIPIF